MGLDEKTSTNARIESVADFVEFLTVVDGSAEPGERWYRGQRDATWKLMPSVYRDSRYRKNETTLIASFRQKAAAHGSHYAFDEWGWITFAQHHGLPTRLLDWSESPLIALYFATEFSEAESDGKLFSLDPRRLNSEAGDDGGPLHVLSSNDKVAKFYLPDDSVTGHPPRAVVAPQTFDRLRFQSGIFTVTTPPSPSQTDNDYMGGSSAVNTVLVPASAKRTIRKELALLGFNESSIYMDLDRIAHQVKESMC